MNAAGQRERDLAALAKGVDLLVIGGGITGAAVARQALRAGLRVALVEARDFAWGTSSRSTKLIHGGLRYLPQLNFKLVREALRERERLRAEAPGLVRPLQMVLVSPAPGITRWQLRAAMVAYHALWGRRAPPEMTHQDLVKGIPGLRVEAGTRGLPYDEAQVDDARLVLRLVREAGRAGGWTLNYVRVKGLVQEQGEVVGASLEDSLDGRQVVVRARAIVNATGAFADRLRAEVQGAARLRPLRGSHLLFPAWRFPLAAAVSVRHPRDGRFLTALPWEDVTLFGTTDLDYRGSLDEEPSITAEEMAYLLEALEACFPSLALRASDVVSTLAGVRPVVSGGFANPSREPRDSWIGLERGLLTITGGKLTTCRATAHAALRQLRSRFPELARLDRNVHLLDHAPERLEAPISLAARTRLLGRYGVDAAAVVTCARPGELDPVADSSTLWAELRWAARAEAVAHLDDLLLRRVRLGLTLPRGGMAVLDRVRSICLEELGWVARPPWRAGHAILSSVADRSA